MSHEAMSYEAMRCVLGEHILFSTNSTSSDPSEKGHKKKAPEHEFYLRSRFYFNQNLDHREFFTPKGHSTHVWPSE